MSLNLFFLENPIKQAFPGPEIETKLGDFSLNFKKKGSNPKIGDFDA